MNFSAMYRRGIRKKCSDAALKQRVWGEGYNDAIAGRNPKYTGYPEFYKAGYDWGLRQIHVAPRKGEQ